MADTVNILTGELVSVRFVNFSSSASVSCLFLSDKLFGMSQTSRTRLIKISEKHR